MNGDTLADAACETRFQDLVNSKTDYIYIYSLHLVRGKVIELTMILRANLSFQPRDVRSAFLGVAVRPSLDSVRLWFSPSSLSNRQ